MSEFRRILVPHDFSDHATGALKLAAKLAGDGGTLRILHVIVPCTPGADIPPAAMTAYVTPEELVTGAKRQLDRLVRRALPKGDRRVEQHVVIGDPYQRIIDSARGMDAIVMATAGRSGLSHLLIGSVAEKIVRHSPIPVVTVRPDALRRASRRRAK
jgi:nucleotide-binding universal stress UspA family protein